MAVPGVAAVVVAASVERSARRIVAVVVAAAAVAAAAATVVVAAAAAGAGAVAPARLHRAGWEAETCWPRVHLPRPRCCKILKRGQVSRAPAARCCAGRYREPGRTPPFEGRPRVQTRLGWEAATRRSC